MLTQFDPSNVPHLTKAFFQDQLRGVPPNMRPHTMYLGVRQLRELDTVVTMEGHPSMTKANAPFQFWGVTIVPVVAESHFLLTSLVIPEKILRLKKLLDYCQHLPTGSNHPKENLEVKDLARATKLAFGEEVA